MLFFNYKNVLQITSMATPHTHILLVEDDELMSLQIEAMLDHLGYESVVKLTSYEQALAYLRLHPVDLIILDIQLASNKTGIDLAERIKTWLIPIVFVTSLDNAEFYKKTLHIPLSGYIVKPFHDYTLGSVMHSLMTNKQSNQYIVLDGEVVKIEDIVYLEVDNTYTFIYLKGGKKVVMKKSLTLLLNEFPENLFLQIHRSFAVNKTYIETIQLDRSMVQLKDGRELPISRRMGQEIRKAIQLVMSEKWEKVSI